jgi:hypothetical protein
MDAGTAALSAAAITGFVTGFVALGGAWIARGTARQQIRADARTRHAHWLASLRLEAHVTYVAEWDKALSEIGRAWEGVAEIEDPYVPFMGGDDVEARNTLIDRTSKATDDVRLSYERVVMLGPEDVGAAASGTWEALVSLRDTTTAKFGGRLGESWWMDWQALRDETRATLEEYRTVTGARLTTAPDPTSKATEPTTAE